MQKLNYEPIPKESSKFISIGTPIYVHSNNKNNDEVLLNTKNDIEFLKSQFQKYYEKSTFNQSNYQIKRTESISPKRNMYFNSQNQSPTRSPNSTLPPKRNSINDSQRKALFIKESQKKVRPNSENSLNYMVLERPPEYVFIKRLSKTTSKEKLIEYHNICCELSTVISRIIHFAQIHYDQKIPISIDHEKFLEYCSSFFQQKESPYQKLVKKEEMLEKKLQQLSQVTKYKSINLDQLRSKLVKYLNIGNENESQITNKKRNKKVKAKIERSASLNESIINSNENDNDNKEKSQSFYNSHLDYSPFSSIDDDLFYFVRSHHINSNNQFHDSPVIEIQKVALEITGIAERNISFRTSNGSTEEPTPNYSLFNDYLQRLLNLILEDQSIFDVIKERDKEKRKKIYEHQIKTVITIAFTRIIFDTAYLFNYDYLLNDQADEKNHKYLHFNQEDEMIEINSKIIQRLTPCELDIPDGFLIDCSMNKSYSISNFQSHSSCVSDSESDSDDESSSSSNANENLLLSSISSSLNSTGSVCAFTPIKRSSKTIHELMIREEDFLVIAEKFFDLQFYSNPFDLSYLIYDIFNLIQVRLSNIAQMRSKKVQKIEKENGIPRSKSREYGPFVQFDDLFLFFLVVFTFCPPKNSRWIAAMLKRYFKLIPNMSLQQSASFFIAVVNYTNTFPSNEEFSPDLMEHIKQIREELVSHNS